jgi:hypothetical protein
MTGSADRWDSTGQNALVAVNAARIGFILSTGFERQL